MAARSIVRGETIILDYKDYRDTDFIECVIVYRGGRPPTLLNNNFTSCEWAFENEALNTVSFLHGLGRSSASAKEFVIQTLLGLTP